MPFTSQTKSDAALILKTLEWAADIKHPLRVLEIGTFGGDTSREIRDWCRAHNVGLQFWGIDNSSHPDFKAGRESPWPFPEANMVRGDSAEVFHLIPNYLDVVLVDGCHCINHAILDTYHYSAKVAVGGYMMFHDTDPAHEQTMKDPHGPDIPEFYNSVLHAHAMINWPFPNWKHIESSTEAGTPWGGLSVYHRIA